MNLERAVELARKLVDAGFRATVEVNAAKTDTGAPYYTATLSVTAPAVDLEKLRALLALVDETGVRANVIDGDMRVELS